MDENLQCYQSHIVFDFQTCPARRLSLPIEKIWPFWIPTSVPMSNICKFYAYRPSPICTKIYLHYITYVPLGLADMSTLVFILPFGNLKYIEQPVFVASLTALCAAPRYS